MIANVAGSVALTPKRRLESKRVSAKRTNNPVDNS